MTPAQLTNVASERAVLAGIAKFGTDVSADVCPILNDTTFTVDQNKVLYKTFVKILENGRSIDFPTILSTLKDLKLDEFVSKNDGLKHVEAILSMPINIENIKPHAVKIRRLQFAREIQNELRTSYTSLNKITGEESLTEIVSLAEKPIYDLSLTYIKTSENTPTDIGDGIDEWLQHVIDNPCDIVGLGTGFNEYDKAIGGGLRRKTVNLIGARTKGGKSLLGANIAVNIARRNIPVLYLDTEMSKEDHWQRILSGISKVEIELISTGKFAKKQYLKDKVMQAKEEIKKLPFSYINISGKPFQDTLSIMRRWILKNVGYENGKMKECLIVYDYLKLMDGGQISNNMSEFHLLGFQTTALHNFAVEYDCPILSFVQLNRDGITKETSDVIAQSDRIGWLCSNFTLLKTKTDDEIANDGAKAGNRKLVVVLARHGPGTEESGYICLQMDKKYLSFRELGLARALKQPVLKENEQPREDNSDS